MLELRAAGAFAACVTASVIHASTRRCCPCISVRIGRWSISSASAKPSRTAGVSRRCGTTVAAARSSARSAFSPRSASSAPSHSSPAGLPPVPDARGGGLGSAADRRLHLGALAAQQPLELGVELRHGRRGRHSDQAITDGLDGLREPRQHAPRRLCLEWQGERRHRHGTDPGDRDDLPLEAVARRGARAECQIGGDPHRDRAPRRRDRVEVGLGRGNRARRAGAAPQHRIGEEGEAVLRSQERLEARGDLGAGAAALVLGHQLLEPFGQRHARAGIDGAAARGRGERPSTPATATIASAASNVSSLDSSSGTSRRTCRRRAACSGPIIPGGRRAGGRCGSADACTSRAGPRRAA